MALKECYLCKTNCHACKHHIWKNDLDNISEIPKDVDYDDNDYSECLKDHSGRHENCTSYKDCKSECKDYEEE